jgi:hypothetical protein
MCNVLLRVLLLCRGKRHNKAIEQKAALFLMCPSMTLGGEGAPCPPYGRAPLGTLQLMAVVRQIVRSALRTVSCTCSCPAANLLLNCDGKYDITPGKHEYERP